jgi:pimeloyl-ACP methyl ester carboxylesterase
MLAEKRIQVQNLSLNVAIGSADGPPLLMLHGVTRRWQCFLPIIPDLAARWRIQALDFPGHGRSQRFEGAYRVVDYVEAVAAIVASQFDEPPAIYGHSLGAMVAAGIAAAQPDRVRALVLEDPPFDTMGGRIAETSLLGYFQQLQPLAGSTRPVRALAAELAEIRMIDPKTGRGQRLGDARDAAALRFAASCLARLDPRVLPPIVEGRWLAGFNQQAALARITCPVLLVQADESFGGMLLDSDARLAAETLADVSLVKLKGAGHLIHWLRPSVMSGLATAFLESCR